MRYRARIASNRISQERRKEHRRTLALIITIMCVPLLGTVLAIVSTTEPDLSDLMPSEKQVDEYIVLPWRELLQPTRNELNTAATVLDGASVRVLGYMGDKAIRAGALVQDFVLLPDAGNLLHPAHRFGDQMIGVRLRESDRVPFSTRQLYWVWGTFRASPGDPSGPRPLYHLEGARVRAAELTDIRAYFQ